MDLSEYAGEEKIKAIENCLNTMINQLQELKEKPLEECYRTVDSLVNRSARLFFMNKELVTDPREEEIPIIIEEVEKIKIYPMENGYRFELPCVLDKIARGKSESAFQEKYAREKFRLAFAEYERNFGFDRIEGKVELRYINYFKKEINMIDNDNINTKPFTDCIRDYVLGLNADDSPLTTTLVVEGRLGDSNRTEVYVTRQ